MQRKYTDNLKDAVDLAIYDELNDLIQPEQLNSFKRGADIAKKADEQAAKFVLQKLRTLPKKPNTLPFVLTQSRFFAARQILTLLDIRLIRNKFPEFCYDGTRGLLIRSDSGFGKTAMVNQLLQALGHVRGNLSDLNVSPQNFYQIPVLDIGTQCDSVFRAGAILCLEEVDVILSENSLNNPLSGVDQEGRVANQEGFTLFGTLNGRYRKRQALSSAFMNRCQCITLPPYADEEYSEILSEWGLTEAYIKKLLTIREKDKKTWTLDRLKEEALKILFPNSGSSTVRIGRVITLQSRTHQAVNVDPSEQRDQPTVVGVAKEKPPQDPIRPASLRHAAL